MAEKTSKKPAEMPVRVGAALSAAVGALSGICERQGPVTALDYQAGRDALVKLRAVMPKGKGAARV